MDNPTFSFVIPAFNEEGVLTDLHRRLSEVAASLDGPSEFILIDDGSTDRTAAIAERLHSADRRVKLVTLSVTSVTSWRSRPVSSWQRETRS